MSWNSERLCDFVTDNPRRISYNAGINQLKPNLLKEISNETQPV